MFKELKNYLVRKVNGSNYDPQSHAGKFGGTGSKIDDKEVEEESGGYSANENTALGNQIHTNGGVNTDLNVRTTMKDVQDWHTDRTQDLLGNPSVTRPSKNSYRNVDAELSNQYYSNMETR